MQSTYLKVESLKSFLFLFIQRCTVFAAIPPQPIERVLGYCVNYDFTQQQSTKQSKHNLKNTQDKCKFSTFEVSPVTNYQIFQD